jgi:prepilin-type N-terminal cleavage/methylation domain-containing protein
MELDNMAKPTNDFEHDRIFKHDSDYPIRRGFTLLELLVVVSIIGIIVSLMIPAVQAARESARRGQCTNNLKQLAMGCLHHESTAKTYPTDGWGFAILGHPDRGQGVKQPGGWIFNILPYIEQSSSYKMQSGLTGSSLQTAAASMLQTPISALYCPSRRPAALYPNLAVKIDEPIMNTQTLFVVPWLGGDGQTAILYDTGSTTRTLLNDLPLVCRNDYAGNGYDYVGLSDVATSCPTLATTFADIIANGPVGADSIFNDAAQLRIILSTPAE